MSKLMFGRSRENQEGQGGIGRFLQGSSNLYEENVLLKFALLCLVAITAMLGTLIYATGNNVRTVVVPIGAGDMYVTGSRPSEAYLRAMTRNIVALAGTYSAYSADTQFQELLSIAHPTAYGALRDELMKVLDDLKDRPTLSIATYLRPEQPPAYTAHDIRVPVTKVRVIGGVVHTFSGDMRIGYAIENGRFWLTSIKEENFNDAPR